MGQPESAYKYFLKSSRLDMDDEHNCAWQGMHSACAAGAWLAIVRGIAGITLRQNKVEVKPHMIPWWEEVSFGIVWHGQKLNIVLNNKSISLSSGKENEKVIPLEFNGGIVYLGLENTVIFDIAINNKVKYILSNE